MTSGIASSVLGQKWPYNAPYDACCNHCISKGLPHVEYQEYCETCNDTRRDPIPMAEVMRGYMRGYR